MKRLAVIQEAWMGTNTVREAVDNITRRFSDAEAYCENRAQYDVDSMKRHIAEVYKIPAAEQTIMVRKAYTEVM